jgi:N-acetylated-alpha-linked acidic dipeptidase
MADNGNNERTPLIAVVHYPPAPPRRRAQYNHSICRRICTTVLALILLLVLTIFILFLFIIPDCDSHNRRNRHGRNDLCIPKHPLFRDNSASIHTTAVGYEDLLALLAATPNETKAREWSEYYTAGPHLAGKNLSQAEWTKDRWVEFGVPQTEIVSYEIYVNYPVSHRLALLEQSGNASERDTASAWKIKYEASLKEDVLEDDPTTGLSDSIPTFHGYSASGNVTAPYVFVNYGTYQDFEDLKDANVTLKGKIALIKYGGIFRGLKVKRAQELGMVGAVIYSDPGDDGEVTLENGNKTYPDGPARNPSSVQRGSVQFLCKYAEP